MQLHFQRVHLRRGQLGGKPSAMLLGPSQPGVVEERVIQDREQEISDHTCVQFAVHQIHVQGPHAVHSWLRPTSCQKNVPRGRYTSE